MTTKIDTKAGPLFVLNAHPGILQLTTNPDGGGPIGRESKLTIRGVSYSVTAILTLVPEDVRAPEGCGDAGAIRAAKGWRVKPRMIPAPDHSGGKVANWNMREGLIASFTPWRQGQEPSSAARRTMIEIIEEAANAWAATEAGIEKIRADSMTSLVEDNERDQRAIEEHEAEIRALRDQIAARIKQIADLAEG
jgi:hypothetical protein